MSDCDRTLRIIKLAGNRGIHSFDLIKMVGTHKAGARVADLRKKGYNIASVPERKGDAIGCRYYFTNKPITQSPEYVLVDPLNDKRFTTDLQEVIVPPSQEVLL